MIFQNHFYWFFEKINTQTSKDIEQCFVTKQIIVPKNSKSYNFGYNGYKALIKCI